MKQKKQLLSILAVTCVCMVCTSCSKDEKLSNRLSGTWRGNWGMSYIDRDGTQYNSDNTVIEFHSDKILRRRAMVIKRTIIRMDLSRKSAYTSIGALIIKPSPSTIQATQNTTAASAIM